MTLRDGEHRREGVDGNILRRLRILDKEAFTRELEACEAKIRWSIAGFIHDPDVAADVFAETVEMAYDKRYRFLAGGGCFRAWVEQIAHYKIREHFRRRRMSRETVLSDASQVRQESLNPEETLVAQEDAVVLASSLGRLDAGQQAVLRLFYGEERTIRSIAKELRLSEATVRKRLSRGRLRLRELLLPEDVYRNLSAEGRQAVAEFLSEDPQFKGATEDNGDLEGDS